MLKKYKYGGMGEAYWQAITGGTKKDGSTKASSESSTTEPTTMLLDTKYTSNVYTSQTQSTSSWGDCSLFAIRKELKKLRKTYLAQNLNEIKIEMARGKGEHLQVLTFYSICSKEAYTPLSKSIQRNFSIIMQNKNHVNQLINHIDTTIKESSTLQKYCYI